MAEEPQAETEYESQQASARYWRSKAIDDFQQEMCNPPWKYPISGEQDFLSLTIIKDGQDGWMDNEFQTNCIW